MKLSASMRTELDRRLAELEKTQSNDPAFQDMPRIDWTVLAVVFAIAIAAVAFINL